MTSKPQMPQQKNDKSYGPHRAYGAYRAYKTYKAYKAYGAYLLFALLALAACTAEEAQPSQEGGAPVTFGVYVPQPVEPTRATEVQPGPLQAGQSIGIYAYRHHRGTWASATEHKPDFMLNQQATCQDPAAAYSYAPLKYWPNEDGDCVSFVAYYPYNEGASGITPLLTAQTDGLPSYTFTVQDKPENQVDFLVSPLLRDLTYSSAALLPTQGGAVHFQLQHATAKVLFSIYVADSLKNDLAYYSVEAKPLTMTNLCFTGTLGYSADGTAFEWSGQTDKKPTYACAPATPLLLLPQVLDDVVLSLDYKLHFKTDGTVYKYVDGKPVALDEYEYANTASVQLDTIPLPHQGGTGVTEWRAGHVYHYHIRLGAHRIEHTGQVLGWEGQAEYSVEMEESR